MLFDTFHVPSLCIASPAPLALYAAGRTTGVVIECGSALTSVTPVFDGLPLTHAVNIMDFGGQDISANIRKLLNDQKVPIDLSDAKLIKEKLGYIKDISQIKSEENKSLSSQINKFELPDGTEIELYNKLIEEASELLCVNHKYNPKGLMAQISDSLNLCDESAFKELSSNIILSGGTSMIKG